MRGTLISVHRCCEIPPKVNKLNIIPAGCSHKWTPWETNTDSSFSQSLLVERPSPPFHGFLEILTLLGVMEKLYKCKNDICLSQVADLKESFWKMPIPTEPKCCEWKNFANSLASKRVQNETSNLASTTLLPTFMNNNYSNVKLLTHEGDLWFKDSSLLRQTLWCKRHFVLLEDKLHCYDIKKGVHLYSGIALRISEVTSMMLYDVDCIKVCTSDGTTRLFRCTSGEERNAWHTALLTAKAVHWLK